MKITKLADLLRKEAQNLDDTANTFTREGMLLRETAAKLEKLQNRVPEKKERDRACL